MGLLPWKVRGQEQELHCKIRDRLAVLEEQRVHAKRRDCQEPHEESPVVSQETEHQREGEGREEDGLFVHLEGEEEEGERGVGEGEEKGGQRGAAGEQPRARGQDPEEGGGGADLEHGVFGDDVLDLEEQAEGAPEVGHLVLEDAAAHGEKPLEHVEGLQREPQRDEDGDHGEAQRGDAAEKREAEGGDSAVGAGF